MDTGTSVGTEVVRRVAEHEGVDPVELDTVLYDAIDVDALENLTAGAEGAVTDLEVTFTYHGYTVTVDGDGEVSVEDRNLGIDSGGTSRGTVDD